jgi:hypothetical protein
LQRGHFGGGQVAPFARLERAQLQRANAHAQDAHDGQAGAGAHLTDLPLAPLVQHYAQPGALAKGRLDDDLGRRGAVAIFQDNAVPPGFDLLRVGLAGRQHAYSLVAKLGMRQPVGQIAIVGQQHQASLSISSRPTG